MWRWVQCESYMHRIQCMVGEEAGVSSASSLLETAQEHGVSTRGVERAQMPYWCWYGMGRNIDVPWVIC